MMRLRALQVVAGVHAVGICLQPVFAGVYLNGSPTGVRMHEPTGLALAFLGLAQLLLATIWWRSGGRWTAPAAGLLIVAGEVLQVVVGYSRQLAIHIPLGIALVAGSLAFAYWIARQRQVVPA
ncbi:hypothetical protein [Kribbella sp. NPDC004875]|uniref:hypothetical protein n=1 Tax=Kribbella sp. NPDC004875 TaxID=3364107 RepID=UPI0036953DE6